MKIYNSRQQLIYGKLITKVVENSLDKKLRNIIHQIGKLD